MINISCDVQNANEELTKLAEQLQPKHKDKVFIFVDGGIVQKVMSNNPDIDVEVIDLDDDTVDFEPLINAINGTMQYVTIY